MKICHTVALSMFLAEFNFDSQKGHGNRVKFKVRVFLTPSEVKGMYLKCTGLNKIDRRDYNLPLQKQKEP